MKWLKLSNARLSERFKCPNCHAVVYCKCVVVKYDGRRENVCNYPNCPYCKERIFRSDAPGIV